MPQTTEDLGKKKIISVIVIQKGKIKIPSSNILKILVSKLIV